jgi:hypothetical protein
LDVEKYLEIASSCFSRGIPVAVSINAINFHSTLKDFRSGSIAALDKLLTGLECRYPELLYLNDEDLYAIVTTGAFRSPAANLTVAVTQQP